MAGSTYLEALGQYGMDASRTFAAELIQERVQWVATRMRITAATARRCLADDALHDLARTMVVTVADEAAHVRTSLAVSSRRLLTPVSLARFPGRIAANLALCRR